MKENTLAAASSRPGAKRRRFRDAWARQAVFHQLRQLAGGQLVLADDVGTHRLGKGRDLIARVRVTDTDFYWRLLVGGSLGAAESFIDGGWTTDDLSTTLRVFARDVARSEKLEGGWARLRGIGEKALNALRRNTIEGSSSNIHSHYDLGNDFFELFLDETMNYSAGIFERPTSSMREASVAKMDRVCRKLDLGPDDHLLEIGTGWGALAVHAASNFGCRVTTTTISTRQFERAAQRVQTAGLSDRVHVLKRDYRELSGSYDKLVSIEMIEAVGHQYLDAYFSQCARLLKPDGLMLLQAIVTPEYRYLDSQNSVDFIRRYIFPGSCLTSVGRMSKAIGRVTDFGTMHVEDIGPDYAETLRRWRDRFFANIKQVRALGFDERFIRMWEYYLCYCEAGFEERIVGDVQMLLARPGNRRGRVLGELAQHP